MAEEKRRARKKREEEEEEEEEREELERRQQERREAASARLARHGLSILNIARHFLKEREREEWEQIRNKPTSTKQAIQLPRFKYRLGKRDAYRANLWRFRKRIAPEANVRKFGFPKTGTLSSPYAAYREMVKKRFLEKMDESRLDAVIALYMRCAGYTPQEVANDLYRHAPAAPTDRAKMKGQNTDAE